MKTLVLANQKGGVGKSAVATLLTHHLAQQGQRVLAIDLDHQGNFSAALTLSKRATRSDLASDHLLTRTGSVAPPGNLVLVPASAGLLLLEREKAQHNTYAQNLRRFLRAMDRQFDLCVVDTSPSPDIRVVSVLASADHVLSPMQLTQEAVDGLRSLLLHPLVGINKIRALLNPKLNFIGLLPTMVEATPFQKASLIQVMQTYRKLLIPLDAEGQTFARLPRRTAIAEAQASGEVLWEMKKTAAREAWQDIAPSIMRIAHILMEQEAHHAAA